ncbi:hypothetical protein [Luteibacter rhizovicinus]|uniref:hypothetical protein n=1 Tax=Luteibacter rhizovicinus TaxID=242606 RepID=UPI000B16E612|nr:hypothetical protein [Luteibacter rhizovicinus]
MPETDAFPEHWSETNADEFLKTKSPMEAAFEISIHQLTTSASIMESELIALCDVMNA